MSWRSGWWPTKGSTENRSSSKNVHPSEGKPIEIAFENNIYAATFLYGKHIVSGGYGGMIRCWRVEDGKEVGTPMDARSGVCSIAVSRDGKWIVSGTHSGRVAVWNAESHIEQMAATRRIFHSKEVYAVDVSSDGTKIATGSDDWTACVWSLATYERLLEPFQHDFEVAAVKFSPNNRLIATATWTRDSIRIYDGQDGRRLLEFHIKVGSCRNQSLAWTKDSKQLFALSDKGNINCLDVSDGTTLSKWHIDGNEAPTCIALASNGSFIAASDDSSVSFWDTTTHARIESAIEPTVSVRFMDVSENYDLMIGDHNKINLRSLRDVLPTPYCINETQRTNVEKTDPKRVRDTQDNNEKIITIQHLQNELAASRRLASEKEDSLNEIIESLRTNLRAQEASSNDKIASLEHTIQRLRNQLADSQRTVDQKEDIINSISVDLCAQDEDLHAKIADVEKTVQQLRIDLADSQHKAHSFAQILHIDEQLHQCESMYAEGRINDVAASLREIANTVGEDVRSNKLLMNRITEFTNRCISMLEAAGDTALKDEKYEEALVAYSSALSLGPPVPNTLLIKWVGTVLIRGSADEVLYASTKFQLPKFVIYQAICDALESDGRVTQAVECFRRMQSELTEDMGIHAERAAWELDFRQRCATRLEKLGDTAMDSEAIEHYSDALALDPTNPSGILSKRSKAQALVGSWEGALIDADKVVELEPSSYKGYERKHAALHGMKHYHDAFEAFKVMLSKLGKSADSHVRELRHQYVDATSTIQKVIEQTIRDMPRVLIDTTTGRLHGKTQQAAAFKELPVYNELRSSMTVQLDLARIQGEVKQFYRYVMLSHRWQPSEPTFQMVENISIYGLPVSPANTKLQTFCRLAHSFDFRWAWSDTCCVNQLDKGVQQESLVAMFRWYRGSSLTIVHLLGVSSKKQEFGSLSKSTWNTRGWTYQEYLASKVVRFYTEDWEPYLGLDLFNHKESVTILSEMEQAMNFATEKLDTLHPGLDRVREKLYLASMRQTTREEDIAYSLFGIFNVAIPVIYGEGDRAVGRLLEHILNGSRDVTTLAWTGSVGTYNSCLPVDLTVFKHLVPPHVPRPIETTEMDSIVTALRSSLPDLPLAVMLHDRLNGLPSPSCISSRLSLPCITFPITQLDDISESHSETDLGVYRATTLLLGEVEIRTADDLSGMKDPLLIHPWINPLLDEEFSHGGIAPDDVACALRLVARLKQPFGALLLETLARKLYRRVATDSLIMVQVREETSLLTELMAGVNTLDIQ